MVFGMMREITLVGIVPRQAAHGVPAAPQHIQYQD